MVEKSSKGHYAKIIADSIGPEGARLTTFEVRYWRAILAEMNTHRMFSRNTASSRAKPIKILYQEIESDPFIPVYWGKNQSGMSAREELSDLDKEIAQKAWLAGSLEALKTVKQLSGCGVHKQIANRVLEPWMWTTQIISATNYSNFFALRCHPDAQPEMQHIADLMYDAYQESKPVIKQEGEWHLPYLLDSEAGLDLDTKYKVCVARCARVSYKTWDGESNITKDIELYEKLSTSGHYSPFEHIAQAMEHNILCGNFCGWRQLRKTIPNEYIRNYVKQEEKVFEFKIEDFQKVS